MDGQTILLFAFLGVLLLLCAFIIAGFFVTRTVKTTVAGFSWFRNIFLEHYIWVKGSSYTGFPMGSRNQAQHRESYQSYEFSHTEMHTTTVNGQTTTTSTPVYHYVTRWRTKYTYEIQQWQPSRTLVAEGKERAGVHWPAYTLDASTWERIRDRQERYLVLLQAAKGKQYKREMNEAAWHDFDEQASYLLKVNLFGQVKRVEYNPEQLVEIEEQVS